MQFRNIVPVLLYQFKHCHVLNQNGINSNLHKFANKFVGLCQLVFKDYCIDSYIDLCPENMGITAQFSYRIRRVACRHPCTEGVCTDVHRICAMVDGSHAAFQILGRCQQFYRSSCFRHFAILICFVQKMFAG